MSALTIAAFEAINSSINVLYRRMLDTHIANFTYDDILELFAPVEDHEILKRAPMLMLHSSYMPLSMAMKFGSDGGQGTLVVDFKADNDSRPFFPKYPHLQPTARPDLVDRLTEWVNTRYKIGLDFGRALVVVNMLDEECKSPAQIRYVWPSIAPLCRMSDKTADLALRIEEFRAVKTPPQLSIGLRNACRKSAGALTMAMMLAPDFSPPPAPVSLRMSDFPYVSEPDIGNIKPL